MPTYLYRCTECAKEFEDWKPIAERNITPIHCGVESLRIMNAPMVAPLFEPYKAVAGDRRHIRTKSEHRSFLREYGYVEVGNDASMNPNRVSDQEWAHEKHQENSQLQREQAENQRLLKKFNIDIEKTAGEI